VSYPLPCYPATKAFLGQAVGWRLTALAFITVNYSTELHFHSLNRSTVERLI